MSVFDKDLVERPPLTEEMLLELKRNTYLGDILAHSGAIVIWVEDEREFDQLLFSHAEKKDPPMCGCGQWTALYEVAPEDLSLTTPPILQRQKGRSILSLDCSGLGKYDAPGYLHCLSQLPPRAIAVIKHITEIPQTGANIDDPAYVEDLLLHSWHNDVISLNDKTGTPFTLHTQDFTVLIPIMKENSANINLARLRNDNLAQIQFKEDLNSWMDKDFLDVYQYYAKIDRISSEQSTAVQWFLNYSS